MLVFIGFCVGLYRGSPFNFVGPVGRRKFAFCNVAGVSCFEGFPAFTIAGGLSGLFGGAADSLLSESDGLHLAALLGDHNVGFGGVVGGALGFVVSADTCPLQSGVWFAGHYLLLACLDAFFAAGVLGTNCFPLAVPSRFLRVVAAYSAALKDLIAFFGK